ncbi:hypothetical protein MHYP_G00053550 [Metynnis hypsauchen]
MQNQQENKHTGEGTAGTLPQEPPSPQKLRCFRGILGVVLSLSDEEWRTLTSDVPNEGTKLQFACLCTKTITSVCKSAIQSYLPTLIRTLGMEAVVRAEEKLEKKAESAFMGSSTSTAPSPEHSAERLTHTEPMLSPVDPSDLICIIVEEFIKEVKMAMQRAICKVASCQESSSSWSKDWKTACSRVTEEMFNILETKAEPSHREDPPVLRETHDKDTLHTEALTRKAIMVGLDVLSASSAGRAGCRTSDRLIAAPEKLKEMTLSSTSEEHLSMHEEKDKAQLPHEDVQEKATRAVSQVLLSLTSHHSVSPVGSKTAPPERNTDREVGAIFEMPDSAAETIAVTQPWSAQQPASEMTQLDHLTPDEFIQSHAERLTNFTRDVLRNTAEPSDVRKLSSDSVLETSWARSSLLTNPEQAPSSLVYVFVEDSVKRLLQHLLSLNPTSPHAADLLASSTSSTGKLQGSTAGFCFQKSDKPTGFSDVKKHFTETLTGSQSKMENPSSLLVKSEHSERNHDSVLDVKPVGESPTASSTAGTPMAKETLEILSISSKENETYTSSSSPENESRSVDPAPVAVETSSGGFQFIVPNKAPVINIGIKTSSELCPAVLVSGSHQSPSTTGKPFSSTSGHLQESSDRKSKVSMTSFRKTRQRLSRIFSAIHRALPNPFQCMTSAP